MLAHGSVLVCSDGGFARTYKLVRLPRPAKAFGSTVVRSYSAINDLSGSCKQRACMRPAISVQKRSSDIGRSQLSALCMAYSVCRPVRLVKALVPIVMMPATRSYTLQTTEIA